VTMRDRLQLHVSGEACRDCHIRMDGIGLALENFDAIGSYRTTDQGLPIDASGEIVEVGTFDGPSGLADLVTAMPDLHGCWVRSLYRHATGHLETVGDLPSLAKVDTAFEANGFRLKDLLVEIVASDAFRYVDNTEAY
jgi:hypothetical protein